MRSSYIKNNYEEVFKTIIKKNRPEVCIECGILDGYSTIAITKALEENKMGKLIAYDLWEDYEFNHGNYYEVSKNIFSKVNRDYITIAKGNCFKVYKNFNDNSIDFLHIDISNDGDVFDKVMELWASKIKSKGIICFEGGSYERDHIDWMIKYNKKAIYPRVILNEIRKKFFDYTILLPFPSMTILIKK